METMRQSVNGHASGNAVRSVSRMLLLGAVFAFVLATLGAPSAGARPNTDPRPGPLPPPILNRVQPPDVTLPVQPPDVTLPVEPPVIRLPVQPPVVRPPLEPPFIGVPVQPPTPRLPILVPRG